MTPSAVAQVTFQLVCPEAGFIENDVNTVECTVRGSDVKAAVAQVPFQLLCPEAGFIENVVNTVECTVRGSDVKGASCVFAVPAIRLETVDAGTTRSIAQSPFPTCDNNWSSVNNDNGRCADRDNNTDIYTYQFNVFADRAYLTNLTLLRCWALCSRGPILGNPFTYKSSETCGPPVIFVVPEPSTTPGRKNSWDNTSTTPTDTESNSPSNLIIGLGVAGVFVVMAAVFSGVYCIRKPRSGGQQNAPPADGLPANFPPDNTPLHFALHRTPLHRTPFRLLTTLGHRPAKLFPPLQTLRLTSPVSLAQKPVKPVKARRTVHQT
ncbi:uncharacterized protein [Littorina saxatilis]|uniref:uncharacterized protein n=1 Tax=Littorina saxatilis TaxID=31220 RepID=UPI0038B65A2C